MSSENNNPLEEKDKQKLVESENPSESDSKIVLSGNDNESIDELQSVESGSDLLADKKSKSNSKVVTTFASIIVLSGLVAGTIFLVNQPGAKTAKDKVKQALVKSDQKDPILVLKEQYKIAVEEEVSLDDRLNLLLKLNQAYKEKSDYENFLSTGREYITLAESDNRVLQVEDMLMQIVGVEYDTKRYEDAAKDMETLEKLVVETRGKSFYGLIRLYELKGKINYHLDSKDAAKTAFNACIDVYNRSNNSNYDGSIGFTYFYLSKMYKDEGKVGRAYKYIRLAKSVKRDIQRRERDRTDVEIRFMNLPINSELKLIKSLAQGK